MLSRMDIHEVDVIKIDVEGAEKGVLHGAQRLLASERPPIIVFEFADWAEARIPDQQPGDAQTFLLASGYHLFRLERGGGVGEELLAPMRRGFAMLLAVPSSASNISAGRVLAASQNRGDGDVWCFGTQAELVGTNCNAGASH
jgi:hypothetical protein